MTIKTHFILTTSLLFLAMPMALAQHVNHPLGMGSEQKISKSGRY